MNATEIFKKVRKIEIKTRGLSHQIFSGHYHSSFKGRGMAFSEVREYQYGDDVRTERSYFQNYVLSTNCSRAKVQ
jgi:hypothetical protein